LALTPLSPEFSPVWPCTSPPGGAFLDVDGWEYRALGRP